MKVTGLLLLERADRDDRNALVADPMVRYRSAHDEVHLSGGEQLVDVELRPPALERDARARPSRTGLALAAK